MFSIMSSVCEYQSVDCAFTSPVMVCAWCSYFSCVCVNGASPVRFVLSLFYMCAFQINPVCVVCVVTSD